MVGSTQGDTGGIVIVLFVVVFAVFYRIAAYFIDKGRITKYFRRKHGEVNFISWEPFGPGWLGDNLSRIYRVGYVDENGDSQRVYVKISLLAGLHIVKF
jgi:hypothetical protein